MKLRRKLISAGFALGASALTLTTSTFAWYTTNNEVSTSSISGMTSSSVDTSSLYIAAASTYAANTIGADVNKFTSYTTTVQPVAINSGAMQLEPVQYVNGAYKNLAGEDQVSAASTPVVEYVLRFQVPNNGAETKVYASAFALTNSAAAADSQQMALLDNTMWAASESVNVGIETANVYNVDLLHALKLTVQAKPVTFTSGANGGTFTVSTDSSAWSTQVYDLDAYAKTDKDVNIASEANAQEYYEKALGTTLTKPTGYLSDAKTVYAVASGSRGSALAANSELFTIPSTTSYMEVRFTFWLDGWDEFCYDTCRQQGFTASINFTTKSELSVFKTFTARTGKADDPTDIYNA